MTETVKDVCMSFMICAMTLTLTIVSGCLAVCAIKFTKIDFNKLFNNIDSDN